MKSPKHETRDETRDDAPKARSAPTMPAGGTIIPAGEGYSVLTATKGDDGTLRFPPALVVIAWSIGADGAAFPVTAYPPSPDTIDTGTVHSNGAVVDAEGNVHAGSLEWQAAVRAREAEAPPTAPPVNVDRPYVHQNIDNLNCTMGNWQNTPDAYAYLWKRDGADVPGANLADYAVQPADVGLTMACVVTAFNALGLATATSNDVVVT
jgi:hypothetical protein